MDSFRKVNPHIIYPIAQKERNQQAGRTFEKFLVRILSSPGMQGKNIQEQAEWVAAVWKCKSKYYNMED